MSPGSAAVYNVQLSRTNLTGPVTLDAASGLPSGATATFSPNPLTANSSTLQINTDASASTGTYQIYLVASGKADDGSGTKYAYANVQLVLTSSGKAFTISGNVPGLLAPGVGQALNLTLTNSNPTALAVTNLTVTIQSVTKASSVGSCSTADYAVTQYSGPYPLSVPKNGSASLASLNVPQSQWPQVRMLDTASNQDGCKGATLTLAYSGSGQGN
jgi:hypothetical protein